MLPNLIKNGITEHHRAKSLGIMLQRGNHKIIQWKIPSNNSAAKHLDTDTTSVATLSGLHAY